MRFLIDLTLDGYNSDEEERKGCIAFIEEQLNFSASGVEILPYEENSLREQTLDEVEMGLPEPKVEKTIHSGMDSVELSHESQAGGFNECIYKVHDLLEKLKEGN